MDEKPTISEPTDKVDIPTGNEWLPDTMNRIDKRIENNFTYHTPFGDQPERYKAIRDISKDVAYIFKNACPESRELSLALTNLEQAVFWANAAIARNEIESEVVGASPGDPIG